MCVSGVERMGGAVSCSSDISIMMKQKCEVFWRLAGWKILEGQKGGGRITQGLDCKILGC